LGAAADLDIALSGPASASAGNTVAYTITLTNHGPSAAANVAVTNATPSGLSFVSTSGDCTSAFPCNFASIESGGTRSIVATFQIPAGYTAPNPITDTVGVGSDTPDPVSSNNSASANTTVGAGADIAITIGDVPALAIPGKALTYTLTVTNNGPSTASSVQLSTSSSASAPITAASGACTGIFPCDLGTMAPGETRVVTATMCVPSSTTSATIALNGLAFPFTADPQTSNNNASVNVDVVGDLLFYNGFDSCP